MKIISSHDDNFYPYAREYFEFHIDKIDCVVKFYSSMYPVNDDGDDGDGIAYVDSYYYDRENFNLIQFEEWLRSVNYNEYENDFSVYRQFSYILLPYMKVNKKVLKEFFYR